MAELKIGDRVLAEGTVAEMLDNCMKLDFGLFVSGWIRQENIRPADAPKFKFSFWDKVIYIKAPEYGVGKIIETDPYETNGKAYRVKFSKSHKVWLPENMLVLAYPNKPKE